MDGVEHVPTAAFGGYPAVPNGSMWPKQVISHVMEGWQTTMIGYAKERPAFHRLSAHFTIGRNGRIVQHVSLWDPAWHVAWQDWNQHSIGIEHEGFSVAGPSVGQQNYSPSFPWPEALILSTIRVHQWVFDAIRFYDTTVVPNESTIITHALTGQPDRVNDPGAQWMSQVRPRILAAFAPTPPTPPIDPDAIYRKGWADGRNTALDEVKAKINEIAPGEK